MCRFVDCFAFPSILPCATDFSCSLTVLSVSLSFSFSPVASCLDSECCSMISYPLRSLGHRLFSFSSVVSLSFPQLTEFAEAGSCVFLGFPCGFPCPPRVPRLCSGPGLVFLSCQMLSLRSWGSLLRVFSSMSGLLVGTHSLSALFSAVSICGGLFPFSPVLVSSGVSFL